MEWSRIDVLLGDLEACVLGGWRLGEECYGDWPQGLDRESRKATMNHAKELLRTSLGARLGRAVGLRLVHSDYGRYYLAGSREGGLYMPDEACDEYLEETLELCAGAGLLSPRWRAVEVASAPEQTWHAAELAQRVWPTQNGLVRLGIAQQAVGRTALAKLTFGRVAGACEGSGQRAVGLLALANLLLQEGESERALELCLRATNAGGGSVAASILTLLASGKAGAITTLQRVAYELDESDQDMDESIEIMVEQRARRVRDGLQDAVCVSRSVRRACCYAGPKARRVLGWS